MQGIQWAINPFENEKDLSIKNGSKEKSQTEIHH